MNQIKTKSTLLLACGFALVALPGAFAGQHMDKTTSDAMFQAMDTNSDGKASRAEHASSALKMFTVADANHDGRITRDEAGDAHAKMPVDHTNKKAGMKMKNDKTMMTDMSADDMIKKCDQNGDGEVSKAEHVANADAMFTKLDTDGDGFVSARECASGHEGMMKDKLSAK